LAYLDDAEQVSLSMRLKPSAIVDAAGGGGILGHVAADAGPARYGIVWRRPATSGILWQ